jgi:hypothetical protein
MADYSKSVDFAAKDDLPRGNAAKVVSGTEINTEFAAIETAVATKVDETSGTATGLTLSGTTTISSADINGGAIDGVTIGSTTAATTLDVDNINIDGNTISSTDTDGNIAITPNGTGEVDISKVDIDSGAIDGAIIGANSAAAITGTTITASTQFTGSGAGLTSIPSGQLTGDLPAIDGSALTGINVGYTFANVSFTAGDSSESVTGLPSGIQELIIVTEDINLNLAGVYIRIQLGTSSGFVTSGYQGGAFGFDNNDSSVHTGGIVLVDTGIGNNNTITSSYTKIVNVVTNKYVASGSTASQDGGGDGDAANSSHHSFIDLSGELDRFRINQSGSRTFDSGTIYYGYK